MVVRHLRNGHHWSLHLGKGTGKIPPSQSGLLHQMDRGRTTRIHLDQERAKLFMAKYLCRFEVSHYNN